MAIGIKFKGFLPIRYGALHFTSFNMNRALKETTKEEKSSATLNGNLLLPEQDKLF